MWFESCVWHHQESIMKILEPAQPRKIDLDKGKLGHLRRQFSRILKIFSSLCEFLQLILIDSFHSVGSTKMVQEYCSLANKFKKK